MKNFCIKKAFTLAEIAITFLVIAIVITITLKITNSNTTRYSNEFMYYSTFTNLQRGIAELLADGALPTRGYNPPTGLCDRLSELFNTVPVADVSCSNTVSGDPGSFIVTGANFITTNGIRFFNFGQDASGTPPVFTVYADIDGPKRSATLDDDVMRFNIYTATGVILPNADSKGANNTDYLSASVRYRDASGNGYVWLLNGGTYRQAVCLAGQAQLSDAGYCNSPVPQIQRLADCDPSTHNACEVIINKPKVGLIK